MRRTSLVFSVFLVVLLSFSGQVYAQNSEKDYAKMILETFGQEKYSSCFTGRTYVNHSITVDRLERASLKEIKVSGTHSYKGRYGTIYKQMDYYAFITVKEDGISIEFHKLSQADFFHESDYWEECKRTIYME